MNAELKQIRQDIELLKKNLLERRPRKFSFNDIYTAFFGALVIGLTFVFKGSLLKIVENMDSVHIIVLIFTSLLILFLEIYFIGYRRVADESGRNLAEFMLKRLPTFYGVSIFVSLLLIFTYGINSLISADVLIKLVFALALPCATGAAIADLLKKY